MSASEGKTVALALGGGGARGYAHIGAIEEIESRGYEVVAVSGTSMGAIIGGLFVAEALDDYRDWVTTLGRADVLRLIDPGVGEAGLMRASRVMKRVAKYLGPVDIEDARMPYTAVAVDLVTEREVWFTEGPMIDAMRASMAIPTVFTPLAREGMVLADGGLLNSVPVIPLAGVRADMIIAVNLSGTPESHRAAVRESSRGLRLPKIKLPTLPTVLEPAVRSLLPSSKQQIEPAADARVDLSTLDVVDRSLHIMQQAIQRYRIAGFPPDVMVDVPYDVCGTMDFHRAKDVIEVGRDRARAALDAYEARLAAERES